jgi:hypothetical protein
MRTLLKFLNLAPKSLAMSCIRSDTFQPCCKTLMNSSCRSQKISNRKTLDFGIYVEIDIRQGVWLEMSLDNINVEELG